MLLDLRKAVFLPVSTKNVALIGLAFCLVSPGTQILSMDDCLVLPPAALLELRHLEETHRVLDRVATGIWPGWVMYRDTPFLFHFPNGLEVLAGYPGPVAGFKAATGLVCAGHPVFWNADRVSDSTMSGPFQIWGGGAGRLSVEKGKTVGVVEITYEAQANASDEEKRWSTERTILVFIHELFHFFQERGMRRAVGGFLFCPTANYSLYSTIEGMALEKAFREKDPELSKQSVRDFLVARRLKRKVMSRLDAQREALDELSEGTASYASAQALILLAAGYEPGPQAEEDPGYAGFRQAKTLLGEVVERLRRDTFNLLATHDRCYSSGAVQALLLQRFAPGWQAPFSDKLCLLEEELLRYFPLTRADEELARERFKTLYRAREVGNRCRNAVTKMTRSFVSVRARRGRKYVIDFRSAGFFPGPAKAKASYALRNLFIYPDGIGRVRAGGIDLDGGDVPVEDFCHLKLTFVNTRWKGSDEPLAICCREKEGDDVFLDAEVVTPVFSLKAPKLKIHEGPSGVDLVLLSR